MTDLTTIQTLIASEVDQASSITAGSSDWNLRSIYINWAQRDFWEAYEWRTLLKEINTQASVASSNATISLPTDYRKLANAPKIVWDGSTAKDYAEIDLVDKGLYADTDNYCYVLGNPSNGYSLVVNPPSVVSGASINYSYYATLPSLVSPADVSMCPDPEFLTQRAIFYLYRARSDPRFQDAGARADLILARLIEGEETRGSGYANEIKVESRKFHRWGT